MTLKNVADGPEWVGIQQLRLAFENSLLSLAASVFCAFVIVVLLWPVADHQTLIGWLGCICVLTILRLMLQQKFEKADAGPSDYSRWRLAFISSAFMSGCAWGALSILLFPESSILHQAYLTFVLGGVSAGAVSSYSPQPGAFPAFMVPTLTPYAISIWLAGNSEATLMAALVGVFMIILLRTATQSRRNVEDVLELQVRNADLTRALHHRATHDSLVDLVNHGEFNRRLERVTRSDRRDGGEFSLVFVDLDLFKEVNDSGGHAAGDLILKGVASILKRNTRAGDTVARVGGDEFALLLEGCPRDRAQRIAEQIRREVADMQIEHEGMLHSVKASIGVSYGTSGVHTATGMLKAADAACYSAKQKGRNQVRVNRASDFFSTTDRFELVKATATSGGLQ